MKALWTSNFNQQNLMKRFRISGEKFVKCISGELWKQAMEASAGRHAITE
jgi:hypothetical protein